MHTVTMGTIIARLRREKKLTQKNMAYDLGVSAQAVSKWECGGNPDPSMVPRIAEFLGVATDILYGRDPLSCIMPGETFADFLSSLPEQERIAMLYGHISMLLEAVIGGVTHSNEKVRILSDDGVLMMDLSDSGPHCLILPEAPGRASGLFEKADYTELFSFLSQPDFFGALVMLHMRGRNHPFTAGLLLREANISKERALVFLNTLLDFHLIEKSEVELDTAAENVYSFEPDPAFLGLLVLASEMLTHDKNKQIKHDTRTRPMLY